MQSNFLNIVRSNDLDKIQTYLQSNIPPPDELKSRINSTQSPDNIKNILMVYDILSSYNLWDFLSTEYYDRNITNLMVIASRGYLPILQGKLDQISLVINFESSDGKTALHYALGNPGNIDIITLLINNGADVNKKNQNGVSPLDMIRELANSDIEMKYIYKNLLDQLDQDKGILFDQLPMDLVIIMFKDPKEIEKLCQSSRRFYDRYCRDSNGPFWIKMLKVYYNLDPAKINKTIREQYTILYEGLKDPKNIKDELAAYTKAGQLEIVQDILDDLLDSAPEDMRKYIILFYNAVLIAAAEAGNKDILEAMIIRGADSFNIAFGTAVEGNHIEIINIIRPKINDFGLLIGINFATINGNEYLIDKFISEIKQDLSRNDYLRLIKDLIESKHQKIALKYLNIFLNIYKTYHIIPHVIKNTYPMLPHPMMPVSDVIEDLNPIRNLAQQNGYQEIVDLINRQRFMRKPSDSQVINNQIIYDIKQGNFESLINALKNNITITENKEILKLLVKSQNISMLKLFLDSISFDNHSLIDNYTFIKLMALASTYEEPDIFDELFKEFNKMLMRFGVISPTSLIDQLTRLIKLVAEMARKNSNIKYLDKIINEYQIYIKSGGINLLKSWMNTATHDANKKYIKYFLDKGADDFTSVMGIAKDKGFIDIYNFLASEKQKREKITS